jgi:hypothetical protein
MSTVYSGLLLHDRYLVTIPRFTHCTSPPLLHRSLHQSSLQSRSHLKASLVLFKSRTGGPCHCIPWQCHFWRHPGRRPTPQWGVVAISPSLCPQQITCCTEVPPIHLHTIPVVHSRKNLPINSSCIHITCVCTIVPVKNVRKHPNCTSDRKLNQQKLLTYHT